MKLVVLAIFTGLLLLPASSRADGAQSESCSTDGGLYGVSQVCHYTHDELVNISTSSSGDAQYRVHIVCLADNLDGICSNPRVCEDPPGSVLYDVFRSIANGPFLQIGTVCLLSGQDQDFSGKVTVAMVESAFQRLDWPSSPTLIEPPNGRTLVNLATNFLTTNTAPTTQSVTLLGHTVDIEATPVTWTWHYGDGADEATHTPGAEYPDLDVTHTYTDAAVTVHPSVDTTYHGRYRIDGGAWNDIPTERTIAGDAVDLQILAAKPVLVAAN